MSHTHIARELRSRFGLSAAQSTTRGIRVTCAGAATQGTQRDKRLYHPSAPPPRRRRRPTGTSTTRINHSKNSRHHHDTLIETHRLLLRRQEGVDKTTVACAIADYFANRGIPGALFVCAAESMHHGSLSRFFPANMLEVH
jgi:hypothetical protein